MPVDMDIEDRLDVLERKLDDNNRMLRAIKRKMSLDFWFGIIKTLVFIGVFYSAWLFVEPFVTQVKDAYQSIQGINTSVGSFSDNALFEYFKKPSTE